MNTMSVCYTLVISIVSSMWNSVQSEWVEMPEFSDETKIYRSPISKHNYFTKFSTTDEPFLTENKYYDEEIRFSNRSINREASINRRIGQTIEVLTTMETVYRSTFNYDDFTKNPTNIRKIAPTNPNVETPTTKHVVTTEETKLDVSTSEPDPSLSDVNLEKPLSETYFNESIETKHTDLNDYLPIDILKKVHSTLKSQPVTIEGKIRFLKTFEKTLITEIESRLASTMAPSRRARGASDHYDQWYDEHEEHGLGFPSIEGALMAISFLTFAVYLVRLVMLLFRNMNNNMPPPPAMNGATVLFGKRKRSIDQLDEDTRRIFESVENFLSRHSS